MFGTFGKRLTLEQEAQSSVQFCSCRSSPRATCLGDRWNAGLSQQIGAWSPREEDRSDDHQVSPLTVHAPKQRIDTPNSFLTAQEMQV